VPDSQALEQLEAEFLRVPADFWSSIPLPPPELPAARMIDDEPQANATLYQTKRKGKCCA